MILPTCLISSKNSSVNRFVIDHKVGSEFLHLLFDLCVKCAVVDVIKDIGDLVEQFIAFDHVVSFPLAPVKGRRITDEEYSA